VLQYIICIHFPSARKYLDKSPIKEGKETLSGLISLAVSLFLKHEDLSVSIEFFIGYLGGKLLKIKLKTDRFPMLKSQLIFAPKYVHGFYSYSNSENKMLYNSKAAISYRNEHYCF
jgi:hypothetical protein